MLSSNWNSRSLLGRGEPCVYRPAFSSLDLSLICPYPAPRGSVGRARPRPMSPILAVPSADSRMLGPPEGREGWGSLGPLKFLNPPQRKTNKYSANDYVAI